VHHFSRVAPDQILKSAENLNPQVVSGPFMMAESKPGDHYTLMRNPWYYRVREGLPYLDRVVFRLVANENAILKGLETSTITSAWQGHDAEAYGRLVGYTLVTPPTNSNFQAMYFNFHNTVLASHLEVRQAIAMAIDHPALIQVALHGFATPLCTDHGSAIHPGYQPDPPCPIFDPVAANKLLEDNGWLKGPDGVRARGGQRLEFEYSTNAQGHPWRVVGEGILQRNLRAVGIQLDIQNYPHDTFFGPFLAEGKASPPSGAVAGRFDIAEIEGSLGYDPDDASVLACDQFYPKGGNFTFYCNPALDALYKQEQATVDAGVRQQIFSQIHHIYLTEFPFIVLYSPTDIYILHKGTHNYRPSPIGPTETINIWEWWCDKGKC
jgi:peptide/nickel transport system substrate-binding protein